MEQDRDVHSPITKERIIPSSMKCDMGRYVSLSHACLSVTCRLIFLQLSVNPTVGPVPDLVRSFVRPADVIVDAFLSDRARRVTPPKGK